MMWWGVFLVLVSPTVCLDTSTLRMVQVLFRHGEGTPGFTYPTDPVNEDYWPRGYFQPTNAGIQGSFDLGRYIRNKYDGFLNSSYLENEVYMVSSNKDRTLMSASALLAGLYPPHGDQVWNEDLLWQPIPVHMDDTPERPILEQRVKCPRYHKMLKKYFDSSDGRKLSEKYKELIWNITTKAGSEETDLQSVAFELGDALEVESTLGLQPPWFTEEMLEQLNELRIAWMEANYANTKMIRLRAGVLIKEMVDHIQAVSDQEEDLKKMYLYSSGEFTLPPVLMALGEWNHLIPGHSSAIVLEVHESETGEFVVKFLYKNDTNEPLLLQVKDCDVECPVDEFIKLTQPFVLEEDWQKACDFPGTGRWSAVTIVSVSVLITLVFVAIGITIFCVSKTAKMAKSQDGYERTD